MKGQHKERGNSPMMTTGTNFPRGIGSKSRSIKENKSGKCGGNLIIPNSVILNMYVCC